LNINGKQADAITQSSPIAGCPHIGRGQKYLYAAGVVDAVKVDAAGDHVTQRVEIEWIEIVRRKLMVKKLRQDEPRRIIQAPIAHQDINRRSPDWTITGRRAGRRPEAFEAFASLGGSAMPSATATAFIAPALVPLSASM
jgi:hypothetical protein